MANPPPFTAEDRANLVAYLDGELDAKTARALEVKLNLNPHARAEADALRRAWDLLDYLPRPEPSSDFTNRTLTRASAVRIPLASSVVRRPWLGWGLGLGWAAAVLLAGVGGYAAVSLVPRRTSPPISQGEEIDPRLLSDLRVIDNLHQYEQVDNISFLRDLEDPDLFGDESGS
jgi:anti-sigma factor RsiW